MAERRALISALTTSFFFFLLFGVSDGSTYAGDDTFLEKLFPTIEVTLANDYTDTIYFMCKNTEKDKKLHPLNVGDTFRFNFTQVAFPMRWCFLYINTHSHGFLWVYNMRSKCTKCFWSITSFPNLYRTDRLRWERQKLFMPVKFDISHYITKGSW